MLFALYILLALVALLALNVALRSFAWLWARLIVWLAGVPWRW